MILTSDIMKTIPEAILAYAHGSPEGHVLSPKEFLHMGNRAAVDQALSRLSRDGCLIRVDRGAYVAPVQGRAGCRTPSPEKVVESLAVLLGEVIVPDGAASAIALGFGARGRVALGYVTSGRSRTLRLGEAEVTLQHAPAWMLTLGNAPAGAAVRAMAWAGPDEADTALAKIRLALSDAEWMTLVACRAALPSWMARAIGASLVRDNGRQPVREALAAVANGSDVPNVDAKMSADFLFNQTTSAALIWPVQRDKQ